MTTDETIMLEVRDGDINKMAILFERYHLRLYNFFFRLTYNRSLSEDLTQSVFERIIRYRTSFDERYTFKSWLFQIARNIRTDHFRKRKIAIKDQVDVNQLDVAEENISYQIEDRERQYNLEKALAQLSADEREVLVLTRYQKLKYQQVGEILNCSEGAVKVKVHRAIKQLRKIYFQIDAL